VEPKPEALSDSASAAAAVSSSDLESNQQVEVADSSAPCHEVPAAIYEQLAQMAGTGSESRVQHLAQMAGSLELGPESSNTPGMAGRSMSEEDYVTVVVTPKLTFQLLRRPEWETVQDISQSELRRGFLSRFPPALWLSSEKFSFRASLPPTHKLTDDTKMLFFRLVSTEAPDERVLLGILRELEKKLRGYYQKSRG